MPTIAKASDRRTIDALLINSAMAVKHAARNLACAAACEERLVDGSEGQLWFLVRALCAEHGLDVDLMIATGRRFAASL